MLYILFKHTNEALTTQTPAIDIPSNSFAYDIELNENNAQINALANNSNSRLHQKIGNQSYFQNIFRKRSYIEYLSLGLRFYSLAYGIIALALAFSFCVNMVLEYCISCIFTNTKYSYLGLLAIYFIAQCIIWWLRRMSHALILLFRNTADIYYCTISILWRMLNLFLCLIFTLVYSVTSDISISDTSFWQLSLRWMVLQGIIWEIGFVILTFMANIFVVYGIYFKDSGFLLNVAQSHLNSIRRAKTEWIRKSFFGKSEKPLIMESNDDSVWNAVKSPIAENSIINGLKKLEEQQVNAIEDIFETQARSTSSIVEDEIHSNSMQILFELFIFLFALKMNENFDKRVCCNCKLIHIKILYICAIFLSIIICYAIGNENNVGFSKFAGGSFIMYYIIVVFRRGKYNCLYYLWSNKFHEQFYNNMQLIYVYSDSQPLKIEENESRNLAVNEEEDDGKYFNMEEKEEKEIDSISNKEKNVKWYKMEHDYFLKTISFDFMDYYSMIETDTNDYYGCSVFCGLTKEICGLCSVALIISIFIGLCIAFSNTSNSSINEYIDDENTKIFTPYPICQSSWTTTEFLSTLDLIFLCNVAYYDDRQEIEQQFYDWFGTQITHENESGWDLQHMYVHKQKPVFFHIKNKKMDLELIAIRGTYDTNDVLQDISLYTEVATLQMFSWIIPLTTILPISFIRDFIFYSSVPEGIIDPALRDRYDTPIYHWIKSNINQSLIESGVDKNVSVLIVGHSLGGGIAEILASKFTDEGYVNVYSFGLSSPGTVFSSRKFGFSVQALDKSSTSLLPRRDPVSAMDMHGGVQQLIECNAKDMLGCHSSVRSFCEIQWHCPKLVDMRNATFIDCVCGNKTTKPRDWSDCW